MKIVHTMCRWDKRVFYFIPTIVWFDCLGNSVIEFKWLSLTAGVMFGEEIF